MSYNPKILVCMFVKSDTTLESDTDLFKFIIIGTWAWIVTITIYVAFYKPNNI